MNDKWEISSGFYLPDEIHEYVGPKMNASFHRNRGTPSSFRFTYELVLPELIEWRQALIGDGESYE